MNAKVQIDRAQVLNTRIDLTDLQDATDCVMAWALLGESRMVCACNVHMVMEGHDDPEFQKIVNDADLVVPDGMPVAWAVKSLGRDTTRTPGPELMLSVCEASARQDVPIALFGSDKETLRRLVGRLETRFRGLRVVASISPPFGSALFEDLDVSVAELTASGAKIVFVGLGCPKQERWMAQARDRLPAVMLGVGAAFDFHAGTKKIAPQWLQKAGLEWAYRLANEPRRLAHRYARHNPRFVAFFLVQFVRARLLKEENI